MKVTEPKRNQIAQKQSAKTKGASLVPPALALPSLIAQRKENKTGMPDQLKSGIENLSGMDMADVKVHYNSAQPAQLNAHAYAQGNQIHIAPGQEKHLPHEAWHVVQQKQGRVKPTRQMKGKVNINDDAGLEKEADVMGSEALKTSDFKEARYPLLSSDQTRSYTVQGYFHKGFAPIPPGSLIATFVELKRTWAPQIAPIEADFYRMVASHNDEGGFDTWLEGRLEQSQEKEAIIARVKQAGFGEGNFRKAVRAVGNLRIPIPPRESMLHDLNTVKDNELAGAPERFNTPPSPRAESRLIQIPNLVGLFQHYFSVDELLSNFEFIIGGGSAMSLKRPTAGRLGRASENMRDIDMDFQFKEGKAPDVKRILEERGVTTMKGMMELIMQSMDVALGHMPAELRAQLKTADMSISGRNTIMFNADDLEYSFHFVNEGEGNELRLKSVNAPLSDGLGSIKIINDDSHWILTKSALTARLKRPDKIQKTLIDACILIGPANSPTHQRRLTETIAIVFGGMRKIGTARNTLRRLAGPDVMGEGAQAGNVLFKGQPISGLSPQLAAEWREFLLGRSDDLYDKTKKQFLNEEEIYTVRMDYFKVFETVLQSIMSKANAERPDIGRNAFKIYQGFYARFDHAFRKRILHIVNIKPRGKYAADKALADPLHGAEQPELANRNVIELPAE